MTNDKDEAEDRSGNDGLNAETDNHKFPNSHTTTSDDEIAGDGNGSDAVQINSASVYPTTVLASPPQPLAEEEPTNA